MKINMQIILTFAAIALLLCACGDKEETTEDKAAELTAVQAIDYPLKFGELGVTMAEYRYFFLKEKKAMESSYGGDELWEKESSVETLKLHVFDSLRNQYTIRAMAGQYGISLDESDRNAIDQLVLDKTAQLGGVKAYQSYLSEESLTDELYRYILETDILSQKTRSELTAEGGALYISPDEILDVINKRYYHTKHICIPIDPDANAADTTGRLAYIQDIYDRAAAGEDFDSLVELYDEDPYEAYSPDARFYHIDDAELPDIYVDEVYGMDIDGIHQPIQIGGYSYIIKRCPLTQEQLDSVYDDFAPMYYSELYGNAYYDARESLTVTYHGDYDKITADTLT